MPNILSHFQKAIYLSKRIQVREQSLSFEYPESGRHDISETPGSDGSTYSIEQDKGRFARDTTFGNEEIDLIFWDGNFEQSEISYVPIDGSRPVFFKTMCFDRLREAWRTTGSETIIKQIISENGVEFETGQLEYKTAELGDDYFKCKIVQATERALVKRRASITLNGFSDKDLDGNPITPLTTTKVLIEALPLKKTSKWILPDVDPYGTPGIRTFLFGFVQYFNLAQNNIQYEIEQSWLPSNNVIFGPPLVPSTPITVVINNFSYIQADNDLSEISYSIPLNYKFFYQTSGGSSTSFATIKLTAFCYPPPAQAGTQFLWVSELYSKTLYGNADQEFIENIVLRGNLSDVPRDYRISIFFEMAGGSEHVGTSYIKVYDQPITINATETAFDSVGYGIFIDEAMNYASQSIAQLPTNAPLFKRDAIHGNQMLLTGLLLRGGIDYPFNFTFERLFKDACNEVCCDYKVRKTDVQIKRYNGDESFYPPIELASFASSPKISPTITLNEEYLLKLFEYGYSTFEESDTENQTLDEVHTKTQWMPPNKQSDNTLSIEIGWIRAFRKIEYIRRNALSAENAKSLANDDDLIALDVERMAPGMTKTRTATVVMRVLSDGQLEIANRTLTRNPNFIWTQFGFTVGSTFEILNTPNAQSYTVTALTDTDITLAGAVGATFTGQTSVTFRYTINGVLWKNRTYEGFDLIKGIDSPRHSSNLRYNPKDNMRYWYPFLGTVTQHSRRFPNLPFTVKNTFWKANLGIDTDDPNGLKGLRVQYNGGAVTITREDISVDELRAEAVISPYLANVELIADLAQLKQLCEDMEETDGFIRCNGLNDEIITGYPQKLTYIIRTGELSMTLELRNYPGIIELKSAEEPYRFSVNNVGYLTDLIPDLEWFSITNGYLSIFDTKRIKLFTPVLYSTVKINGVTYSNELDFINALNAI